MFISRLLLYVQKKTRRSVQSARDILLSGGIIVITGILIVWLSIFLYTAFYYAYVPSISYVRPVHLTFRPCNEKKGVCSFPSAVVQLTDKQQLLMVGQPYKVNLHLEMPESPANKELGMFMVCAYLRSRNDVTVVDACRSTMLHYRSTLLHALTTMMFSPMMIFGTTEEKQNVVLELFSNFEEDQSYPVTKIYIEIRSRHIEFYSATVSINAHLSGLRYLMFHWPILSAIIGISTNLFFIALVCILSYLHFTTCEDTGDDSFSYEEDKKEDEHKTDLSVDVRKPKVPNEYSTDSSSSEESFVITNLSKSEESYSSHIEVIE